MATLVHKNTSREAYKNPNTVKAVMSTSKELFTSQDRPLRTLEGRGL